MRLDDSCSPRGLLMLRFHVWCRSSYQLGLLRVSAPLHAVVSVVLSVHTQQDMAGTAAAAAAPHSVFAPHPLLRAVAADAVMLTGPGCLATAVALAG